MSFILCIWLIFLLFSVLHTHFSSSWQVLEPLSLQSPSASVAPSVIDSSDRKSTSPGCEEKNGRRSLSLRKTPEQKEKRQMALREQAQQGENCQVQ